MAWRLLSVLVAMTAVPKALTPFGVTLPGWTIWDVPIILTLSVAYLLWDRGGRYEH